MTNTKCTLLGCQYNNLAVKFDALAAELTDARKHLDTAYDTLDYFGHSPPYDASQAEAHVVRIRALEAALKAYGQHWESCRAQFPPKCTCGLSDALATIGAIGTAAETSSKQPDQYAAHTQDCAIRRPPSRFGEYVCDCPASKIKGE